MAIETMYPEELTIIGLDTEDGPEAPLYDERIHYPLEDKFIRAINGNGVLVPVLVKKDGDKYFVIDGRQRVRAARAANERRREVGEPLMKVHIKAHRADTSQLMSLSILTNEHRQDDDLLIKAIKTLRLFQQTNDEEAVALNFSVGIATVRNRMKVAEAAPELHDAYREGKISGAALLDFAKLNGHELQVKTLNEVLAGSALPEGQEPAPLPASAAAAAKRERKRSEGGGQKGIRRGWLRKALKTAAAKALLPEQYEVLQWFIEGADYEDQEQWFAVFATEAEIELGDKA